MKWPWARRRVVLPEAEASAERLQASALIHLGQAWRAHMDGEPLRAIRHLRLAIDAITELVSTWER